MRPANVMDLERIALIVQILGGASVIAAVVFGVGQVRQFQQQRRDQAALELMRAIQDREFIHAFRLVYELPDGIGPEGLRARGTHVEEAAYIVGARFETIGLLAFRGNIPFAMVEEIVGGLVIDLWRRLGPWVEGVRRDNQQPLMLEWFQWLAERLTERGRAAATPAYQRWRDWRPRY